MRQAKIRRDYIAGELTALRVPDLAWHADRYRSAALETFKQAAIAMCADLERELDLR